MIGVCGECLIDFIPKPTSKAKALKEKSHTKAISKIDLPLYQPYIGGSPLNTATAIARLTTPTAIITRLSKDPFGQALKKHFILNGVDIRHVSYGDEPSTIGFVIPPQTGEQGENFLFFNATSADRMIKSTDIKNPLPAKIKHIHFASISLQMEPCATTYETLMKREYKRCTISLDPNVRPLFIKNRVAYRQRIEKWLPMINVFRASDQDLSYLYGLNKKSATPTKLRAIMHRLVNKLRFPQIGILTLGGEGVVLFTPNIADSTINTNLTRTVEIMEIKVKSPKVKDLVDTVGSGDSFTGAFLHTLYKKGLIGNISSKTKSAPSNQDLRGWFKEALEFSVIAAAINCTREGCDPATLKEVQETQKNAYKSQTQKRRKNKSQQIIFS